MRSTARRVAGSTVSQIAALVAFGTQVAAGVFNSGLLTSCPLHASAVGAGSPEQIERNFALCRPAIGTNLSSELKSEQLLREDAPTPA